MYLKPATGLYLIHCPTYTVFQKLTGVCVDRCLDVREKRRRDRERPRTFLIRVSANDS